jgi:hypothetical protein
MSGLLVSPTRAPVDSAHATATAAAIPSAQRSRARVTQPIAGVRHFVNPVVAITSATSKRQATGKSTNLARSTQVLSDPLVGSSASTGDARLDTGERSRTDGRSSWKEEPIVHHSGQTSSQLEIMARTFESSVSGSGPVALGVQAEQPSHAGDCRADRSVTPTNFLRAGRLAYTEGNLSVWIVSTSHPSGIATIGTSCHSGADCPLPVVSETWGPLLTNLLWYAVGAVTRQSGRWRVRSFERAHLRRRRGDPIGVGRRQASRRG